MCIDLQMINRNLLKEKVFFRRRKYHIIVQNKQKVTTDQLDEAKAPPEIASSQKDHVTNNKLAHHG